MSYDDGGDGGRGARIQSSLEGYVDVPQRIAEFREKYPDGSLQPRNLDQPIKLVTIGDQNFIEYVACAYRTPDDPRPGVGVAWETFPGKTPYTKNSEAMNAETSAWGRAIVAALAADAKAGVATQQEIRNRREEQKVRVLPNLEMLDEAIGMTQAASNRRELVLAWNFAGTYHLHDTEIPGENMRYREFWVKQRDIVDGLGQNTNQPADVAPDLLEEQRQVRGLAVPPEETPTEEAQEDAAAAERDAQWAKGEVVAEVPVDEPAGEKAKK